MATLVKLSGSTDGRPIKLVAVATPGTVVHAAHATLLDRIFLWACNTDSVDRKLTLEHGGVTSPDDTVEITVPAEVGWVEVSPGIPLTNSLSLRGFGATANVIIVAGYVLRG